MNIKEKYVKPAWKIVKLNDILTTSINVEEIGEGVYVEW